MPWSTESRQSRGYGAEWEKIRKLVLERDGHLCQPCLKQNRPTVAREVDHITSKAKAAKLGWSQTQVDHPDNLQAICTPCHKAKTAADEGKTYRPKVQIGLDGWPME